MKKEKQEHYLETCYYGFIWMGLLVRESASESFPFINDTLGAPPAF